MIFVDILDNRDREITKRFNSQLTDETRKKIVGGIIRGKRDNVLSKTKGNTPIVAERFVTLEEMDGLTANKVLGTFLFPLIDELVDRLNKQDRMKPRRLNRNRRGQRTISKVYDTRVPFRIIVRYDPVGPETEELLFHDDGHTPRLDPKEDRNGVRKQLKKRTPGYRIRVDAFLSE